jgi:hypothetical protein
MSQTSKQESVLNSNNAIRASYNAVDKSITTAGFLTGKVGHKIERVIVDSYTDDYKYFDAATLLYTIRITYSDVAKSEFVSAERVS